MSTRSALDQDLVTIRDDILRMGALVEQAIERGLLALREHDRELAQTVINDDDLVDNLHNRIEEQVTRTIALQQPMARDLRKLIAYLLISNELERMGDHAEGTARTILRYPGDKPVDVPVQITQMRETVHRMFSQAMDALVAMDPDKARVVASLDNEVDALYQDLFHRLVAEMSKGRLRVEQGTYLLWAGHNLERIGDRLTNICERVIYALTGSLDELNPRAGE